MASFVMDNQLKSAYCLFNQIATNDDNVPMDLSRNSSLTSSSLNHYDELNTTENIYYDKCIDSQKSDEYKCIVNESIIRNKPTSFRFKTSTTESFESSISLTSKNMRSIPHVAINVNNNNNNSIVNQIEKNESYLGEEQENRKEDSENAQNTLNYYSRQHRIDYNRFVEDEEQQNCSTCNLSFCQPIDFVIHIQKVHLGLKMANNENNLIKPLKESVQSNKNHIRKSNKIHRNVDDTNGINRVTYRDNNNHTKDQIRNNEDGIDHPLSLKSTRKRSYQSVKTVGYD
ncbi:hypothetical protein Smp_129200 [Schistosoma mansoni]|uniref:hypothetical protein n=1 Tax=Schistosoma mansoni TaxID=6183 RepID=UPI0001A63585|nr:hypothetical protein Smp_129200 [Schistosoma mansoni]|eukprot:XP_018647035.1 hypothetical protein Smp_129200 [Schistosoma mansoni]